MWGRSAKTESATLIEDSQETAESETVAPKKGTSIISADVKVLGAIISKSNLAVEGSVEGDINCAQFTLGKSGFVHGNIIAEAVTIRGKVIGNINARTIMLASNGSVEGDLTHSVLIIEEGGSFDGRSKRVADPVSEKLAIAAPKDDVKQVSEPSDKEANANSAETSNGDKPDEAAISQELKDALSSI